VAVHSSDLIDVAIRCAASLGPLVDAEWSRQPSGMRWTCRFTLEHTITAVDRYAFHLAARLGHRVSSGVASFPEAGIPALIEVLSARAHVLAAVAEQAPPGVRAYHAFGRSDAEGFLAMGCVEMLVHTDDIAATLGDGFTPDDVTCRRVVDRLFPWAPRDTPGWLTLRWCTGRVAMPGHPMVAPNWAWFAAPLAEWDGQPKTQESYRLPD
jgi:hypothetical protein